MARLISPNFLYLRNAYKTDKLGAALEGSSRSGKTWGCVDFVTWLTSRVETSATINIIRDTHVSFNTTLLEDFNRRLPMYGVSSPLAEVREIRNFKLFGNQINFLGADNIAALEGVGSDYVWFNEMLDIPKPAVQNLTRRCRKFWWGDYNPKYADHYVYSAYSDNPEYGFLKTTFLDNPFISRAEKTAILSYEPTHPEDRGIEDPKKRRPHPTNVKNGTADDFAWEVYGLGNRRSNSGLIYPLVTWITEFPKDVEKIYYGIDFGYTQDAATIVRIGVKGRKLFLEKLAYTHWPTEHDFIASLKDCKLKDVELWAPDDNTDYINAARRAGFRVLIASRYKGSLLYGISLLRQRALHIVDCQEWRKEQSNYRKRIIQGITLDEPVDDYNHLWDAARMAALNNLKYLDL